MFLNFALSSKMSISIDPFLLGASVKESVPGNFSVSSESQDLVGSLQVLRISIKARELIEGD